MFQGVNQATVLKLGIHSSVACRQKVVNEQGELEMQSQKGDPATTTTWSKREWG